MGKLKSVKIVDNISLDLVKNGQYVKIEGDKNLYMVIYHHSIPKLIPIDIKNIKPFNDNIITDVYDAKNGNTLYSKKRKIDLVGENDESIRED